MSNWGWPQTVIALIFILSLGWQIFEIARDHTVTSDRAAGKILLYIAYYAFYGYALHAGGFW